jgi:hypothetical protein
MGPNVLADSCFHGWSDPKSLMHTSEAIVRVEQRDLVHVVLNLFAEAIRQASESAHAHSHREVLSFDVAGANVLWIGIAGDLNAFGSQTLRGAAAFLSLRIIAEDLNQLSKVNSVSKCIGNGGQVHLVPVRGQLDSACQPASNILKEVCRTPRVPPTYKPANYKLCISVNCNEGPNIPSVSRALQTSGVTFLDLA